jgi:hypothetical protein
MEELLTAVATHLEFFGYSTVLEDGVVKVSHTARPYFWVIPVADGALFRTLFKYGSKAAENPAEFGAFVNRSNYRSITTRFVFRDGFMSAEAWFPNCYDKKPFADFFARYLADIEGVGTAEPAAVAMFFPTEADADAS